MEESQRVRKRRHPRVVAGDVEQRPTAGYHPAEYDGIRPRRCSAQRQPAWLAQNFQQIIQGLSRQLEVFQQAHNVVIVRGRNGLPAARPIQDIRVR